MSSRTATSDASSTVENTASGRKTKKSRPAAKPSFGIQALSIGQVALLSISTVLLLHLAALALFTKGFLLKRTTLETRNECDLTDHTGCTLPAKYDRAVILLVDALRWDFLFPRKTDALDFDRTHHNHLTVPIQLTHSQPEHSQLYKAIADPPTTTLQRLKAITTGSLPTFVDAGSNFAGSRVDEDNWLEQANHAGKRIAFMGDDTWLTIFPETVFAANHSFPFDSFHVEDLDTVDAGVRHNIIPLLDQPRQSATWDILIGHPLGLDHAGHRFGASHAETTRKLKETDALLSDIVARLADKDLLIVMGDHGMDAKGDHGGDSPDETDAGLWLYSKTPLVPKAWRGVKPFASSTATLSDLLLQSQEDEMVASSTFFANDGVSERQIQQISLVPTLSLLLGLPIPFNNLGSVIPELFLGEIGKPSRWTKSETNSPLLATAMQMNSRQMRAYLEEYASHGGGSDLAPAVPALLRLHDAAAEGNLKPEVTFPRHMRFMQAALHTTRGIWARFDPVTMAAGLVLLLGSLGACVRLYKLSKVSQSLEQGGPVRAALTRSWIGAGLGSALGLACCGGTILFDLHRIPLVETVVFGAGLGTALGVTFSVPKAAALSFASRAQSWAALLIVACHTLIFASNSFILWEDTVTLVLQQLPAILLVVKAMHAPERRLRWRMAGFASLAMLGSRMVAFSSVCREEQHPYCTATFYGSSGTSVASPSAILAAIVSALALPSLVGAFLDITRSRQAWMPFLLSYSIRGALTGGAMFWAADYLEQTSTQESASSYGVFKSIAAKLLMLCCLLLATTLWYASPVCIDVEQETITDQAGQPTTQVRVIGFANAIGSSYLLLYLAIFAIIFLLAQPIGQVVMAIGLLSLISFLESNDSARDSAAMRRAARGKPDQAPAEMALSPPTLLSVIFIALFGFVQFFATGHQAVLSSIQWKTAFVGFPKLTYPISPILVVLNTVGPFILSAAALPLLVFWNTAPSMRNGPTLPLLSNLLVASFAFLAYHTVLTFSSALFAAHLRRHLMVWKVFAPRFMLSAMTLLAVDATLLVVAVGWGGLGTLRKLGKTFGTVWS